MPSVVSRPRVVEEPIEETVRRLEAFVRRMERRYECSSDDMASAVRGGAKETAEVARWLISFRTLQRLRAAIGHETGTPTISTR